MIYGRFLKILDARGMFRIQPGLERIGKVLAVLGHPQDRIPCIHIAGTNGKGSVAAGLESVLRSSGYRTGLYTSPHLFDLRERIQIDGTPLVGEFMESAQSVLEAEKEAKVELTYFEVLTAIAFLAFAKAKIDIAVVECGLGGRWDATNMIAKPLFSIITSVGLDHTQWLGQDDYAIALQKAGIIKSGCDVISGVSGQGYDAIRRVSREQKAPLLQLGVDFRADGLKSSWQDGCQSIRFKADRRPPETVIFGLLGEHQVDNAALIMAAINLLKKKGWRIPTAQRNEGLKEVYWPGRFQRVTRCDSAPVILDGAHNPPAMKRLLATLESSIYAKKQKTFVFSAYKDKDYASMGQMIARLAAEVCLCPLSGSRKADLAELRRAFAGARGPVRSFKHPSEAFLNACKDTPRDGVIVVTGSLTLVGDILALLDRRKVNLFPMRELSHV